MLSLASFSRPRFILRYQTGISLLVTLVVLLVMALLGLALMRMTIANSLVVGNMTYKEAAISSADQGIEKAVQWLESTPSQGLEIQARGTTGYIPDGLENGNPAEGQSWLEFWNDSLASQAITLPEDAAGNVVSYVIQRMCDKAGPSAGATCEAEPLGLTGNNSNHNDKIGLNPTGSRVAYRITVHVKGPRNTVSLVQARFAQ